MLSVVVLICAANVARPDCTPGNAVAVVANQMSESATACGMMAQAQVASTLQLQTGEYLKVVCQRRKASLDEAKLSSR
jgi:hypothetical protein